MAKALTGRPASPKKKNGLPAAANECILKPPLTVILLSSSTFLPVE
ncbi:hypothetical protein OROGR_005817 [Orobanche gracilis]